MSGPRRALIPAPLPAVGEAYPIPAEASHHLCGVLRLRAGAHLEVIDGLGRAAPATLIQADRRRAVLQVTAPPTDRSPRRAIHLGLGLLKGSAMDDALRMATEAGATHLHPFVSDHTVARSGKLDRWQRVVEGAVLQSLRADLPTLPPPASLEEVLQRLAAVPHRYLAAPGAHQAPPPGQGDAAILIGPEGGWSETEMERAEALGYLPVSLGPWVLRARTAAAVAVASLTLRPAQAKAGGRS